MSASRMMSIMVNHLWFVWYSIFIKQSLLITMSHFITFLLNQCQWVSILVQLTNSRRRRIIRHYTIILLIAGAPCIQILQTWWRLLMNTQMFETSCGGDGGGVDWAPYPVKDQLYSYLLCLFINLVINCG